MQLLAVGKWSKIKQQWNVVVAMRHAGSASGSPLPRPQGRTPVGSRPRPRPER